MGYHGDGIAFSEALAHIWSDTDSDTDVVRIGPNLTFRSVPGADVDNMVSSSHEGLVKLSESSWFGLLEYLQDNNDGSVY